ncbi:AraC family transcriptional regulator [Levilactobacillus fujinensis]|uniref:Helix-turn-helix domain-containing protein n=1 Tax=Levilactobacillus fujinensis TaxID=2486024 RepID=A0ABW1TL07_9LACO|nr:AraC family transcriptional regulator [Levilactobacillus fujinensis]
MAFFQYFGMESTPVFKYFDLEDLNFPLHLHRAYELLIVQRGRLHVQIDNANYHVDPKQFIIIFPNQIHGFDMAPATKVTVVIFSPEFIGSFSEHYQEMVPVNPVIYLKQPLNFSKTSTSYGIKGLLYNLCDTIVQQTEFTERKRSSQFETVYQILDYVTNNFQETCTLKDLAGKIGFDYSYLSKTFKKTMHLSFPEYLNSYRISYSRQLLKNTDLSITQIAYNCGYASAQSFNRNFKQFNDCTPQVFRHSVVKYDKSLKENYISG